MTDVSTPDATGAVERGLAFLAVHAALVVFTTGFCLEALLPFVDQRRDA